MWTVSRAWDTRYSRNSPRQGCQVGFYFCKFSACIPSLNRIISCRNWSHQLCVIFDPRLGRSKARKNKVSKSFPSQKPFKIFMYLLWMNTMTVCRMLEPHLPDRAIELYKRAADVYNVSLQNTVSQWSWLIISSGWLRAYLMGRIPAKANHNGTVTRT